MFRHQYGLSDPGSGQEGSLVTMREHPNYLQYSLNDAHNLKFLHDTGRKEGKRFNVG